MAEVYLRDLNEKSQKDFLNWFKGSGRDDLIKAHDEGHNIEIGESFHHLSEIKVEPNRPRWRR